MNMRNLISRFSRQRLFEISWRLAILSLPWQTRWFADASLGGWPWEQGRWSVYGSMVLIIATIGLGWMLRDGRRTSDVGRRRWWPLCVLVAVTCATTLSRTATVQWWIEVLALSAFVWTLWSRRVSRERVLAWFAAALLPVAAFAIWQYFSGVVIGSSWLGIAPHLAADLGASVVQYGDVRSLRAYGVFPHPNILGGWMAIGLVAALECASRASDRWRALVWSAASAIFSITLVVSFARGAWIAAAFGILAWSVITFRRSSADTSRQFAAIALIAAIALAGAVVGSQRAAVFARADLSQRLEAKSVDARWQSLVDGWSVFRSRPMFGAGPNAELAALALADARAPFPAPLEPPHDVALLALADLGLVGSVLLLLVLWPIFRSLSFVRVPFWGTLLILASFDHYPWSTWSGMCLVALVVLGSLSGMTTPDPRPPTPSLRP